jgi:hypothetical protein
MTNTIGFKGQTIHLDSEPRIRVCNRCRYVVGEGHPITGKVYTKTHRHHEVYDYNDPMAHTIELCPPCHRIADFENYVTKSNMARLLVVIPDELEKRLREHIQVRYKGKKQGFITYTVTEAIERYLQEEERKKE